VVVFNHAKFIVAVFNLAKFIVADLNISGKFINHGSSCFTMSEAVGCFSPPLLGIHGQKTFT